MLWTLISWLNWVVPALVVALVAALVARPAIRALSGLRLPNGNLPQAGVAGANLLVGLVRHRTQSAMNIAGLIILFIAFHLAAPELSSAWWGSSVAWVACLLVIGISILYWSDGDPNTTRRWIVRGMTVVLFIGSVWAVFGIQIDSREPSEPAKVTVSNNWAGWQERSLETSAFTSTATPRRTNRPPAVTEKGESVEILGTIIAPVDRWSEPPKFQEPRNPTTLQTRMTGEVEIKIRGSEDSSAQSSMDRTPIDANVTDLVFRSKTGRPETVTIFR